jgi:hypothetical protein
MVAIKKYKLEAIIIDRGAYGEPPFPKSALKKEILRGIRDTYVGVKDFKLTEVVDGEKAR